MLKKIYYLILVIIFSSFINLSYAQNSLDKEESLNQYIIEFSSALEENDLLKAEQSMREAIKIAPKNEDLYWNLFTVLYRENKLDEGKKYLNDYISLRWEKGDRMAGSELKNWMRKFGIL